MGQSTSLHLSMRHAEQILVRTRLCLGPGALVRLIIDHLGQQLATIAAGILTNLAWRFGSRFGTLLAR